MNLEEPDTYRQRPTATGEEANIPIMGCASSAPLVQQGLDAAKKAVSREKEGAEAKAKEVGELASETSNSMMDSVAHVKDEAVEKLQEMGHAIKEKVEEVVEDVEDKVDEMMGKTKEEVDEKKAELEEMAETFDKTDEETKDEETAETPEAGDAPEPEPEPVPESEPSEPAPAEPTKEDSRASSAATAEILSGKGSRMAHTPEIWSRSNVTSPAGSADLREMKQEIEQELEDAGENLEESTSTVKTPPAADHGHTPPAIEESDLADPQGDDGTVLGWTTSVQEDDVQRTASATSLAGSFEHPPTPYPPPVDTPGSPGSATEVAIEPEEPTIVEESSASEVQVENNAEDTLATDEPSSDSTQEDATPNENPVMDADAAPSAPEELPEESTGEEQPENPTVVEEPPAEPQEEEKSEESDQPKQNEEDESEKKDDEGESNPDGGDDNQVNSGDGGENAQEKGEDDEEDEKEKEDENGEAKDEDTISADKLSIRSEDQRVMIEAA